MTREVLFRGKRTDNGEWAYGTSPLEGFGLNRDEDKFTTMYNVDDRGSLNCYIVNPSSTGQYTGLTDKNGVKIFEGDILKYEGNQYEVIWDEYGWNCKGFYNSGYDYPSEAFSEGMGGFEVIGNIHDKEDGE